MDVYVRLLLISVIESKLDKVQEKKVYCGSVVKWECVECHGEEAMVVGGWGREELGAPWLLPSLFVFSLGLWPMGAMPLTFRVDITSSVKLLLTSS